MTEHELNQALEYVNKNIEKIGGPPNYFTYGEIFIPDYKSFEDRQKKHFLRKLRDIVKTNMSNSEFRKDFADRLLQRLHANQDITIVLGHFTPKEIKHMYDKKFPLEKALTASKLDFGNPYTIDMIRYLENAIEFKVRTDAVNFYMTYAKQLDLLDILKFFPFDEVKRYELDTLKTVKLIKSKGLRFGVQDLFAQHIEFKFKSPILLPETSMLNQGMAVGQYLEDMPLVEFFNRINNYQDLQVKMKDYYIDHSEDKEFTRKYFECREKDNEYIAYAKQLMKDYKEEHIIEKPKIII